MKRRSDASGARNSTATATTATAEASSYVGRFAPTPSGELHLGSLYAAAASYLDALAHQGRWLLRLEDLDRPREQPGAAGRILRTLEDYGFAWHGEVMRQSARDACYRQVLESLRQRGLTFACRCSRAQLDDHGRYPGTCRALALAPQDASIRLRLTGGTLCFEDRVQGQFCQDVLLDVGDPILQRRDGLFSYLLAVVVDDHAQGVTHVVRGADLLDNTPRQIHLQNLLSYAKPSYAHVPLLTETSGAKLAKSRRSLALGDGPVIAQLVSVFTLLGMPASAGDFARIDDAWRWARSRWTMNNVPKRMNLPVTG